MTHAISNPTGHLGPARLPSFHVLADAYLQGKYFQAKAAIGGQLDSEQFVDTCAMRMSWTLNHVHIPIPPPHHSPMYVLRGRDIDGHKAWYAIRHAEIREWLRHILGPPQISERNNPVNKRHFLGFKGIIVLDVAYIQHPGQPNATGHIDLWNGSGFMEDSESSPAVVDATFNHASRADLWTTPVDCLR